MTWHQLQLQLQLPRGFFSIVPICACNKVNMPRWGRVLNIKKTYKISKNQSSFTAHTYIQHTSCFEKGDAENQITLPLHCPVPYGMEESINNNSTHQHTCDTCSNNNYCCTVGSLITRSTTIKIKIALLILNLII